MVVVALHRHLGTDVAKQLGGNPRVLDENAVGAALGIGGARGKVAEVADRGCHDVQAGLQPIICRHGLTSSN
jgi:hypothetical protein